MCGQGTLRTAAPPGAPAPEGPNAMAARLTTPRGRKVQYELGPRVAVPAGEAGDARFRHQVGFRLLVGRDPREERHVTRTGLTSAPFVDAATFPAAVAAAIDAAIDAWA